MEIDLYRSNPALGSTDLKMILENPRLFSMTKWHGYEKKRTEALDFGDMFHTYILENEKWDERYVKKAYDSFRTNEAKEWRDAQTKIIYDDKTLDQLDELKTKFFAVPGVEKMFRDPNTQKEVELYGEIDGVAVKAKIDILVDLLDGFFLTVDPKTIADTCSSTDFAKQAVKYRYHIQEWLYREVLKQNNKPLKEYLFGVISKLEYSGASMKRLPPQAVEHAESLGRTAINKYKIYLEKYGTEQVWPECEEISETVNYPAWAYYQDIEQSIYCPEGVFLTT